MTTQPQYTKTFTSVGRGRVRVAATDEGDVLFIGVKQGVHGSGEMSRDELVDLRDWINDLLEETE